MQYLLPRWDTLARNALRACLTVLPFLALAAFLFSAMPQAQADSPGRNGARTIAAAGVVVNQYTSLAAGAAVGAASITVVSAAALNSTDTGGGALASGDVILIYQARGASINTANSSAYGDITSYGNAGNYEIRTVRSVAGNVISLESDSSGASCAIGLKNSFSTGAQVIRVPQYSALTVNSGASIVPVAWDGTIGGVVALLVQNTATINGSVSAAALGFRGGVLDNFDRPSGTTNNINYATDDYPAGGQKGEGIASGAGGTYGTVTLAFSNPGGNFDMAAPANGGGGGGSHNGGGGGGSNAALALTPYCTAGASTFTTSTGTTSLWCGQGTMPGGVTGGGAWALDPAYKANGNANTVHVGGGRGGYTFSNSNQDALTVGPGFAAWGGNYRRSMGGWGGRPLTQTLNTRLFFGGGGGAGGANSGPVGGAGGPGGGLVMLIAGSVAGGGSIDVSGAAGLNTTGGANDAPGGGGGGGTALVYAGTVGGISLRANGGGGGVQTITSDEAEGPGGGGGGGILAVTGGAPTRQANGGAGGTSASSALTEFPRNGATDGTAGNPNAAAPNLLSSYRPCTSLSVTKSNAVTTVTAGGTTSYVLTVINSGPSDAPATVLTDPIVPGVVCTTLSCSGAFSGAACPIAGSTTLAYLQGTGITVPTLPSGSSVTFTLGCGITATGQ